MTTPAPTATATAAARRPGLATEVATWPPVEAVDVDGWRVGFSEGFTRRGNSVAALRAPGDVEAALDRTEDLCAARGLPAVVRVCRDSAPDDLDARLARRGYAVAAPTSVMVRDLASPPGPGDLPPGLEIADRPTAAWLHGWLGVKAAQREVDLALAERLLRGAPAAYLTLRADRREDGDLGVIRAAVADGWVGLSCLAVAPAARRTGVGRLLTLAALDHARTLGAGWAFLQVEEGNAAARALYEGLRFEVSDRYHYRERPVDLPSRPARETLGA
ncbi:MULTISPECIES: N-acetyltransferase [unclassified Actinotalea]|uniref:GNAT family N-acetyltransferase n=1 Tax=unclassified Actinotalea TaxID=2638618 RepID=UPI0015F735CE|nr:MULTISPECIES: GNAT family N-acetyltransferase [unclassified Actinotalea]